MKRAYLIWYQYYQILPKLHRHSLGIKIDKIFVEIIEAIAIASYLPKEEKLAWIKLAVRKIDTLKVLLLVLWESGSIENKKIVVLSENIEKIGKMLGGWRGQTQTQLIKSAFAKATTDKQNSPNQNLGEK